MTEDQIMQRVAEIQKRVFTDIDKSKSGQASQSFQIVGANGLNVQQQGNQVAISADASAIQGEQGPEGPQGVNGSNGEQGPQGEQGIKGDNGENGEKGEKGEKGDKGDDGEKGEKGDTGDQGIGVTGASVTSDLSFTFTLSNGSQITTPPLLSGDGILYFSGGAISTIPSAGGDFVLTGGSPPSWTQLQSCN